MKKWVVLLVAIVTWGCQKEDLDDIPVLVNSNKPFDMHVPSDFSWSGVLQDVLLVDLVQDSVKTYALDSTLIELYSDDDELLDALTIFKGQACFNIRIPTATNELKLRLAATNTEVKISSKVKSFDFEVPEFAANRIRHSDKDHDGLFDQFDAYPNNPNLTISIGNKKGGNKSAGDAQAKTRTGNFYIFEDLWPTKGDYDFNDITLNSVYSWKRGKNNFIEEIFGVCNVEWNSTGFGIGFELFEARGNYLIYTDNIITDIKGAAEKTNAVKNGFKIVERTENSGRTTKEFTIKIKSNSITEFVCVPYLYRANNERHQIRPFGTPPTQEQLMKMFRSADDDSPNSWNWLKGEKFVYPLTGKNAFYRSRENYPWGIEFMAKSFRPSPEEQSLLTSYPELKTWVESDGFSGKEWYNHPIQ